MIKMQEEYLLEILELKKQNPEMDIHFCIDSDQMLEEGWTAHKIGKVEISPWLEDGEYILTEESEIRDHFECLLSDECKNEAELEKAIDEKYDEEVKDAICVYTYAG